MPQPLPHDLTPSAYRESLDQLGVAVAFTQGQSMRPLIWTKRHYVTVQPLEGEPRVGDVLLFERMDSARPGCILHRLVGKDGPVYITRGDNCLGSERVARQQIIGRMTELHRYGPPRWFMVIRREHISIADADYQRYSRRILRLWPLRRRVFQVRALAHRLYRFIIPRK